MWQEAGGEGWRPQGKADVSMMGWITAHTPAGLQLPRPGCLTVSQHGDSAMPFWASQPVAEDMANLMRRGIADRLRVDINQVMENWREGLSSEEEEETVKHYEQRALSRLCSVLP